MKKVRRMMRKEIQRNNSFADFSATENPGSTKSRSRAKSADAFVRTKSQASILKENAAKLGELAQVCQCYHRQHHHYFALSRLAPRCPRAWPGLWRRSTTSWTTLWSPHPPPSPPRSTGWRGSTWRPRQTSSGPAQRSRSMSRPSSRCGRTWSAKRSTCWRGPSFWGVLGNAMTRLFPVPGEQWL